MSLNMVRNLKWWIAKKCKRENVNQFYYSSKPEAADVNLRVRSFETGLVVLLCQLNL
jgi:hypothetical protein